MYIKPVVFLNEFFQDCPKGHVPIEPHFSSEKENNCLLL